MSLAQTNTDLDQALDELDVMGKAYLQLALMWRCQEFLLNCPQGTEEALETPNTSTNIDPYP